MSLGRPRPEAARKAEEVVVPDGRAEHDRGARSLRLVLVSLDVASVATAWALTLFVLGAIEHDLHLRLGALVLVLVVVVVASLVLMYAQRLYLARVCGVRVVEVERILRVSLASAVVAWVVARSVRLDVSAWRVLLGAVLTFVLLSAARELYTAWLRRLRAQGRYVRPIVLVGTNAEAHDLARLLEAHADLGYRVVGVLGDRGSQAAWGGEAPWVGEVAETVVRARELGANGALLAVSSLSSEDLNHVCRELLHAGMHVQLSSGLRGIDHRRLRALPLAYEPLFYLEPATLLRWQRWTKKAIDVVFSLVGLLLAAPVLVVAAIAIKFQDGGPVFFRHDRVGRDGKVFAVFKLRTMPPETERADDVELNTRTGPLFKDPRRTRVGRILEGTSIDELPQFINVLRGEMSIVGPRPATPREVGGFDEQLLATRQLVPPGITGLWQVEARDNPSFDVYRRLDLFYVENWSVSLDLAIIWATFQAIAGRLLLRHRHDAPAGETAVGEHASALPATPNGSGRPPARRTTRREARSRAR